MAVPAPTSESRAGLVEPDTIRTSSYMHPRSSVAGSPAPSRLKACLAIQPSLPLPHPRPLPTLPASHRAGATLTRRSGYVVGSLGGDGEDWGSVDTVCRTIAEDQVCKLLLREPETAGVCVGSTLLTLRSHGELKVFQGFEQWVCTYEHGYKESDVAIHPRHWEGTRRYHYTALVEMRVV